MILPVNGQFITSSGSPTTIPISMPRTCRSLTSSLNSIFPVTVPRAKQIIRSTMRKVSVEPMVRQLSRAGRELTRPLCLLGRWVRVLVIWPWMTLGAGGIGRRYWEWVQLFLQLHRSQPLTLLLGELLLRNLLKALLMKEKHTSENKKFDATFPAGLRNEWSVMIQKWERDKSKPNPYTHAEKGAPILVSQSLEYSHLFSY